MRHAKLGPLLLAALAVLAFVAAFHALLFLTYPWLRENLLSVLACLAYGLLQCLELLLRIWFIPKRPPVRCPRCRVELPRRYRGKDWHQRYYGWKDCQACGLEVNQYGEPAKRYPQRNAVPSFLDSDTVVRQACQPRRGGG